MFAEECQSNLMAVLQQWFQVDDTSDRTLSVHFSSFIIISFQNNKRITIFLFSMKAFETFLHFGDGCTDYGNL